MSRQGQWEYRTAIHARYREATRAEKGRIRDELCPVTRVHRKSARRLRNGPPPGPRPSRRRHPPACRYRPRGIQVLAAIGQAAGAPWSVRLPARRPRWSSTCWPGARGRWPAAAPPPSGR